MADLSKITLPNGSTYDLKDSTARSKTDVPVCTTAAGTAAKVAVCTHYYIATDSYTPILIQNTNTAASALTLNINSQGAKPMWINGAASSSSNHTLPKGVYIIYYDGTNYYFRTDGQIPTGGVSVNEKAHIVYNESTKALDFVFD